MLVYRLWISIIFVFAVSGVSHADWNTEYMHIYCDVENNRFKVSDVTGTEDILPQGEHLQGELIKKMEGVEFEELDVDTLIVKQRSPVGTFPSCTIKSGHENIGFTPRTFTIHQTKIDQGNVQRQCGAAIGAAFEVRMDGKTIAEFASAKDVCYRGGRAVSPTVSFENNTLEICRGLKLPIYSNGLTQLRSTGQVCTFGSIESHLDWIENESEDSASGPDTANLIELRKQAEATRRYYSKLLKEQRQERQQTDLEHENVIRSKDETILSLNTQIDILKAENMSQQDDLKLLRNRPFGEKFKDLFRKEK